MLYYRYIIPICDIYVLSLHSAVVYDDIVTNAESDDDDEQTDFYRIKSFTPFTSRPMIKSMTRNRTILGDT